MGYVLDKALGSEEAGIGFLEARPDQNSVKPVRPKMSTINEDEDVDEDDVGNGDDEEDDGEERKEDDGEDRKDDDEESL